MPENFEITLKQARLMRHALGLPNKKNKSYRNHYACGTSGIDNEEWTKLVDAGYAGVNRSHPLNKNMDNFWVTELGAEMVREDCEALCKEDFPKNIED